MNQAYFSRDSVYRYWLQRVLVEMTPQNAAWYKRILWIMLNPSIADCTVNDPTIKQCMAFSALWGYHSMEVVNLFAFRATDPRELNLVKLDPVGSENDAWIRMAVSDASLVVCAWGSHRFARERAGQVARMLDSIAPLHCLHINADGMPKHPLYIARDTPLRTWSLPV